MISGKGILYTVLAAASTAAIAGTMLTGGTRGEKMRGLRSKVQNFLGSFDKSKLLGRSQHGTHRSELDQIQSMGHS